VWTKNIPYTFNRGGYFYLSRPMPSGSLHHDSYPRIVQRLTTKSQQSAKTRALVASAKLDKPWSQLRLAHGTVYGPEAALQSDSSCVAPNAFILA
jgi:hypothetical protein